jgi:3-hydroxybutyryl-CoA dehydrogenase
MIHTVAVIGSGSMGSGITQVALMAGCRVILHDTNKPALERAGHQLAIQLQKLADKGKITEQERQSAINRLTLSDALEAIRLADLVIEAIVEDLAVKKEVFAAVSGIVAEKTIVATNTSSLSVTALATAVNKPERFAGIHFFNPAPLMALVEVIPGAATSQVVLSQAQETIRSWGKTVVVASDTPGFIVNRVARPFYGEALRLVEEHIADPVTIDTAMRQLGFKMGPFELMDMIGMDVNYAVTESVWRGMYYDARYQPSLLQKKLVDAGWLGKKTGRGFYDYAPDAEQPIANTDTELLLYISTRILNMLINEAADAVYKKVASVEDIELAMTKGVNYPKGLLRWCDELGAQTVVKNLDQLFDTYHDMRYRCTRGLRQAASSGFYYVANNTGSLS